MIKPPNNIKTCLSDVLYLQYLKLSYYVVIYNININIFKIITLQIQHTRAEQKVAGILFIIKIYFFIHQY